MAISLKYRRQHLQVSPILDVHYWDTPIQLKTMLAILVCLQKPITEWQFRERRPIKIRLNMLPTDVSIPNLK